MRKITQEAGVAFYQKKRFKKSNTEVIVEEDVTTLLLFSNEIAKIDDDGIWVTVEIWNSDTTRERLSGIPGVCVSSKKGELTLNGHPWDGHWVNILNLA